MEGYLFLRKLISLFESRIGILFTIVVVTSLFSPFILNDVVVIILTPVIVRYSKNFGVDPAPLLVAEITFTNIASSLTPFGNPQNILLWSATRLSFHQFVAGTWFELAISGIISVLALLPFRKRSGIPKEYPSSLGSSSPAIYLVIVTVIVIVFSLFSLPTFVSLGFAFLAGFAFTYRNPARLVKEFDAKSLLILCIFVSAVTVASLFIGSIVAPYVSPLGRGEQPYSAIFIGVVSNLISNVPATQLVLSTTTILPMFAPKIAVEAGLAGNIDPIGSFANLLVLIIVKRAGLPIRKTIALQFVVGIVSF